MTWAVLGAGGVLMLVVARRARRRRPAAVAGCALALLAASWPGAALAQLHDLHDDARGDPGRRRDHRDGGQGPGDHDDDRDDADRARGARAAASDRGAGAPARPLRPQRRRVGRLPRRLGLGGSPRRGRRGGLRLHATSSWTFGLDVEWNPWLAFNGATVHAGAVNVYGSAMLRLPLAYENFNLQDHAEPGPLVPGQQPLRRAVGQRRRLRRPSSPLGVEWKLSRIFFLVINPLGYAAPAPQLKNVPPSIRSTGPRSASRSTWMKPRSSSAGFTPPMAHTGGRRPKTRPAWARPSVSLGHGAARIGVAPSCSSSGPTAGCRSGHLQDGLHGLARTRRGLASIIGARAGSALLYAQGRD